VPGDVASEPDVLRLFQETDRSFGSSPRWSNNAASS
jgi:hypothetical protein